VLCYFRGKEITSPSGAEGLWEILVPCAIHTSNAGLREKDRKKKASYPDNGVHSQCLEYNAGTK